MIIFFFFFFPVVATTVCFRASHRQRVTIASLQDPFLDPFFFSPLPLLGGLSERRDIIATGRSARIGRSVPVSSGTEWAE